MEMFILPTYIDAPDINGLIVNACAVLHNIRVLSTPIEENVIFDDAYANEVNDVEEEEQNVIRGRPRAIA